MPRRPRRRLTTPLATLLVTACAAPVVLPLAAQTTDDPPADPAHEPATHTPTPPQDAPASADAAPPTDPADQRQCDIQFYDGRRIRGVLLELTDERIDLSIRGVRTSFDRSDVAFYRVFPPVREQYATLRAQVAEDDAQQLIRLAEWLMDHRMYEEAVQDLGAALRADPGNPRARDLQTVALQQLAMRVVQEGDERPRREGPDRSRVPLLSEDQVNLLKVYEVDLNDPPRMSIDREVIQRFTEEYRGNPMVPQNREARIALLRKPPDQILELFFRVGARDYYGEVRVLGQPRSLSMFKQRVHDGWLMNGCATNRCHGGQSAGRLWLATQRPRSERTALTNFLILDRTTLEDGTPLINWDRPAESPLIQLALPRDRSLFPHPEVVVGGRERPWRPVFGSVDDRPVERVIDWIEAMYRPRPSYPIQYDPPVPAGYIPPPEDQGPIER